MECRSVVSRSVLRSLGRARAVSPRSSSSSATAPSTARPPFGHKSRRVPMPCAIRELYHTLPSAPSTSGVATRAASTAAETRQRVAVAVSGGVDSAVTALLLARSGKYDVVGVHMTNWDPAIEDEGSAVCRGGEDARDAEEVCGALGVAFRRVEFVPEYWESVFSPFLRAYRGGRTPNPDVDCNRYIKFHELLRYARDELGASALATGHYCRTAWRDGAPRLLRGRDPRKDQSYFLSRVPAHALQYAMFPLGDLEKFVEEAPGVLVDVDARHVVGEHAGTHLLTIGQRARIGGAPEPYFVVGKDVRTRQVYVAQGARHGALYSRSMRVEDPVWVSNSPLCAREGESARVLAQLRYNSPPVPCTIRLQRAEPFQPSSLYEIDALSRAEGCAGAEAILVEFDDPQHAITPSQICAFYSGDECLGGAFIDLPGLTEWELGQR